MRAEGQTRAGGHNKWHAMQDRHRSASPGSEGEAPRRLSAGERQARMTYRAPSPRPRSEHFVPRYKSVKDVKVLAGLETLSLSSSSNQYITSIC